MKKKNYYNLIFYGWIISCVLLFVSSISVLILSIVMDEASQTQELGIVVICILSFLIFLNFLLSDLIRKYDKKITSKLANKPICVKPTIARVYTFDKNVFHKNLESLNYELWQNEDIDIPVYIKVKRTKFLLSLLGLSEDKIIVMIFYEFDNLDKNIVKKIKDDKKEIILGLRKEYKRKTSLLIQIGSVVILEYSSDYFKKHITEYAAQYGREVIQDCYLLKEDNKVYVPRLLIEVDSMSLKRQLNKILNVHIRQRF